jgi:predicted outer membrane repeat protein
MTSQDPEATMVEPSELPNTPEGYLVNGRKFFSSMDKVPTPHTSPSLPEPTENSQELLPLPPLTLERTSSIMPEKPKEKVCPISPKKKPKTKKQSAPQGIQFLGNSSECKGGALSTIFKRSVIETLQQLDLKEAKFVKFALSKQWGERLKKVVSLSSEAREKQMVHLMSNLERFKSKYPTIASQLDSPKTEEKPKKKKRRIVPTSVPDQPSSSKKRIKKS